MFKQPTRFSLVSGSAEGHTPLNAFDHSLLAAGIGDTNLVRMSSILPPRCFQVDKINLPYGALVPVAYADHTSSQAGDLISAAVAIAIPQDPTLPGLIMEHHGSASLTDTLAIVREMAIQGMMHRGREIKEVLTASAEHTVKNHSAVFAGVVLWDDSNAGPLR